MPGDWRVEPLLDPSLALDPPSAAQEAAWLAAGGEPVAQLAALGMVVASGPPGTWLLCDHHRREVALAAVDDPTAPRNAVALVRRALAPAGLRWGLVRVGERWWLLESARSSGGLVAEACGGAGRPVSALGPAACRPGGSLDVALAASDRLRRAAGRRRVAAAEARLRGVVAQAADPAAALASETRTILAETARQGPAEAVADLQERLLGLAIEDGRLARSRAARQASGAFYTPAAVARQMVSATLRPLLETATSTTAARWAAGCRSESELWQPFLDLRVVDPSAGAGTFLLAAIGEVAEALLAAPHRVRRGDAWADMRRVWRAVARSCVAGLDADPAAVATARLVLGGLGGRVAAANVAVGDVLAGAWPAGRAHAVVGNPPYLSVKRGHLADRAGSLRERFRLARGQWDSYMLFAEQALRQLGEGGRLGFVLPRPALANESAAALRSLFAEAGGVAEVIDLGRAFPGAAVEAVGVVVDRRSTPTARGLRSGAAGAVPRRPAGVLPLRRGDEDLALLHHLAAAPGRLADVASLARGLEIGKRHPAIGDGEGPATVALLRGEDVSAWMTRPVLRLDRARLAPPERKPDALFEPTPKLLLRRVAPRPLAALDDAGCWVLNTLYVVRPQGVDPTWLLGVLNSDVVAAWFQAAFSADERIFPYLRQSQVLHIPLPEPDRDVAELVRARLAGCPAAPRLLEDRLRAAYGLPPRADTRPLVYAAGG